MSNNNHPHGHLSQPTTPNPSWNPLQIPSYIPRQPQLAHMSNERTLVRSPLAWHATAQPPDAIYNFMSANHKNLEHHQMNSLLPPYVSGALPFDSMDLSLQSNRSAPSPATNNNKSGLSQQQTAHGAPQQQQQQQHASQQQQPQHHLHTPNNFPTIHSLTANHPSGAHSQQHGSAQHTHNIHQSSSPAAASTSSQSPANANAGTSGSNKYLNSNGDCESLLPQPTGSSNNSVNYMQSNREENFAKISQLKRSYENEPKSALKPVELVSKDCSYTTTSMTTSKLATHALQQQHVASKKNSPLRNYTQQQHHHQQHSHQHQSLQAYNLPPPLPSQIKYNGPHTPPTPHSPVMQQTSQIPPVPTLHQMQSPSGGHGPPPSVPMDYNQLHLQHHIHNTQHALNYVQQHIAQHQDSSSPAMSSQQQSQHIHYSASQHHNQHIAPSQHQSQSQQMQQHFSEHPSQPQPPVHSRNSGTVPHITNLDALPKQRPHSQNQKQTTNQNEETPVITDLTTTSATAYKSTPIYPQTVTAEHLERHTSMPDAPESPFTATSNEESLESNSNSSSSRVRRKRKSSQVMRVTNNDKHLDELVEVQLQQQQHRTPNRSSNSRSPKVSPAQRKSPRSLEYTNFSLNVTTPPSNHDKESLQSQATQYRHENGRIITSPMNTAAAARTLSPATRTRDIADCDATQVSNFQANSNENSNSNSSNAYNADGCGNPKTKKQRQAQIQRNISVLQPQINDDDGGDQCEEKIDKAETTAEVIIQTNKNIPAPPSPQSISSSSSSSSTSTRTSHSSASAPHLNPSLGNPSFTSRISPSSATNLCETDTPASPAPQERGIPPVISKTDEADDEEDDEAKKLSQNKLSLNIEQNSKPEKLSPMKVHNFEEVENKLEEMFAGIEDEPPAQADEITEPNIKRLSTHSATEDELSLALELDTVAHQKETSVPEAVVPLEEDLATAQEPPPPVFVPNEIRPLATKAAMKSTVPSPRPESPKCIETKSEDQVNIKSPAVSSPVTVLAATTPSPAAKNKRTMPQRRLSVGMDPAFLRVTMEMETKASKKSTTQRKKPTTENVQLDFDDDKPSTSAAAVAALVARKKEEAAAAAAAKKQFELQRIVNIEKSTTLMSPAANPAKKKNTTTAKGKKSKGGSATKTNNNVKKGAKNAKQQKKKWKQTQQPSDDETAAAVTATKESSAAASTESKYKSPFILVRPNGSVSVINAATADDVSEKLTKVKKPVSYAHERKNIRGMHSSTLGNKYDADTTDSSWICVFCKRGPHKIVMGDLFGPYLVSIDCEEYRIAVNTPGTEDWEALFENKRKLSDMVKVRERNLPVVAATVAAAQQAQATLKGTQHKRKRKTTDEQQQTSPTKQEPPHNNDPLDCSVENKLIANFRGMTKTSENSYEVWLHEDCAIWAPNVCLVGGRIVGLDAVVWDSTRYYCSICGQAGAILCCLSRACKAAAHVPCAREQHWSLIESDLKVYCQQHAPKNTSTTTTNSSSSNTSQLLPTTPLGALKLS